MKTKRQKREEAIERIEKEIIEVEKIIKKEKEKWDDPYYKYTPSDRYLFLKREYAYLKSLR
jgi:SMC interacting uncharacterized protein involved in chromosome segregation